MPDDQSSMASTPLTVTARQVTAMLPLGLWCWAFVASLINGFSTRQAVSPAIASTVCGLIEWLVFLFVLRPPRLYFGSMFGGLFGAVTMSFSFTFPKVRPWPLPEMLAIGIPLAIGMGLVMGLACRLFGGGREVPDRTTPLDNEELNPQPTDAPRT